MVIKATRPRPVPNAMAIFRFSKPAFLCWLSLRSCSRDGGDGGEDDDDIPHFLRSDSSTDSLTALSVWLTVGQELQKGPEGVYPWE